MLRSLHTFMHLLSLPYIKQTACDVFSRWIRASLHGSCASPACRSTTGHWGWRGNWDYNKRETINQPVTTGVAWKTSAKKFFKRIPTDPPQPHLPRCKLQEQMHIRCAALFSDSYPKLFYRAFYTIIITIIAKCFPAVC